MVGLHIHRPKDDIYTCIYIRILQRSSVLLLGSPTLKKRTKLFSTKRRYLLHQKHYGNEQ